MKGRWTVAIRTPMGTIERPVPEATTQAGARLKATTIIEDWRDQNPSVRVWDAVLKHEEDLPVRSRPGDCENCGDPACRGCNARR